jgi:hypothetical protein
MSPRILGPFLLASLLLLPALAQTTTSESANNTAACGPNDTRTWCDPNYNGGQGFTGWSDIEPVWNGVNPLSGSGEPITTIVANAAPKNVSKENVHNLLPSSQRNAKVFITIQAWFSGAANGSKSLDGVSFPYAQDTSSHKMNGAIDCPWNAQQLGATNDCGNDSSVSQARWDDVVRDLFQRGYDGVSVVNAGGDNTCPLNVPYRGQANNFSATCQAKGTQYRVAWSTKRILRAMQNADGGTYAGMQMVFHLTNSAWKFNDTCGNNSGWTSDIERRSFQVRCVQEKIRADFLWWANNIWNTSQGFKDASLNPNLPPVLIFDESGVFAKLDGSALCTSANPCTTLSGSTCNSSTDCWTQLWQQHKAWMAANPSANARLLFRDGGAFDSTQHPSSDGGFLWIGHSNAGTCSGSTCTTGETNSGGTLPNGVTAQTQLDWKGLQQSGAPSIVPTRVEWFYNRARCTWETANGTNHCPSGNTLIGKLAYASAYKGFDSHFADWWHRNDGPAGTVGTPFNAVTSQQCGQVWHDTFDIVDDVGFDSAHPAQVVLVNTWDDFEEGHETQTGIDNCLNTISPTLQAGDILHWDISFSSAAGSSQKTIDHYSLFDQNVAQVEDNISKSNCGNSETSCSIALDSFQWEKGVHTLFVKAIGKSSIQNKVSTTVAFTANPVSALSKTTVNCGDVQVGFTGTCNGGFSITNNGNAVLRISQITSSDPTQFPITNTCPTVTAGAVCQVSPTFHPSSAGTKTATITIASNDDHTPQQVSLSGTGCATQDCGGGPPPDPNLTITVLNSSGQADFGVQAIGTTSSPLTVRLQNTGGGTVTISSIGITGDYATTQCGSLSAGAICDLTVTFTPTAQGIRAGVLSVNGDPSGSIQLTGIGGEVVFANIDQSSSWTICGTSQCTGGQGNATGTVNLVSTPSLDGTSGQFTISGSTPYSNVRYETTLTNNSALAHYTMDASVLLTDPNVPQGFYLGMSQAVNNNYYPFKFYCDLKNLHHWRVWDGQGMTWQDTGLSCVATDFPANTWVHLTFDFDRTAANQMHYQSITKDGHEMTIEQSYDPATHSPDTILAIFEEFGNSTQSTYSVTIDKWSITASGNANPGPDLSVNVAQLAFPNQATLNQAGPVKTITLMNTGTTAQSIGVSIASPFNQTNDCPASLSAGGHCTVSVTFTPTAKGAATSTLSITGSTMNINVPVSGIGGAITFANIDQTAAWTAFPDAGANGTLTLGVSSPAQDGSSARFQIGGTGSYHNVHWEDTLVNNSALMHYTMDGYVFMPDPASAQAFQIGLSQAVSNNYYPFKFLCDLKSGGFWKIWDGAGQTWSTTTAACNVTSFPANTWVHVIVDFERTAGNQLKYNTIILNEVPTPLGGITFGPATKSPDTILATFGLNGNSTQSTYSVSIDSWNVTAW